MHNERLTRDDLSASNMFGSRRGGRDCRRSPARALALTLLALASVDLPPVARAFELDVPSDLKPIQLVRKPKHSQGQLEVTDEGIEILQNLTAPFAIISAVGPTRTGKSSLLGRAFLNSPDFFEVGTGVHSHTTGIWMTNKPVSVNVKGVGRMQVIVVDTEGFHGVQERTSRTYENNLFALSYLLSSVLIYNSAYPAGISHSHIHPPTIVILRFFFPSPVPVSATAQ